MMIKSRLPQLWREKGEEEHDNLPTQYTIPVPLSSGDAETIKHLTSLEAVKNLGISTCPDDSTTTQLDQTKDRIEDRTMLIRNSAIPICSVWTSYFYQLCTGLRYGMGASFTPLQ